MKVLKMREIVKIKELEQKIGYQFENFDLLVNALRHSSYANEHRMDRLANFYTAVFRSSRRES